MMWTPRLSAPTAVLVLTDLEGGRGKFPLIEIQARQSVSIDLPAATVFASLCDLEKMTGWSSAVISIEKTTPEEALRSGAIVKGTFRFLGQWLDFLFEVIEYEPDRCLTLKSIAGYVPCLFCYQLAPAENGGTTLAEEAVINLVEEPEEPMKPVITSALRRQLEYDLLTLKDILEARAAMCEI